MKRNFLAGALAGIKLASNITAGVKNNITSKKVVGATALVAAAAALAACTNPTSDVTDVNAIERARRQNQVRSGLNDLTFDGKSVSTLRDELVGFFNTVDEKIYAIVSGVAHDTDVAATVRDNTATIEGLVSDARGKKLGVLRGNATNWVQSATFYFLDLGEEGDIPDEYIDSYLKLTSGQSGAIDRSINALTLESDVHNAVLNAFKLALPETARDSATITPSFSEYMAAQTRGRTTRAQNRVAKASYDAARAPMFAELASARARTGVQL